MPKKISQLVDLPSVSGSSVLPVVSDGTTYKAQLKNLVHEPGELSVLDYGAVAYTSLDDARSGTDSSAAFQAAFDAMGDLADASRGGRLIIPAGYYRISENLFVRRSGHIQGTGTGGRYARTVLAFDDGKNITFDSTVDSADGGGSDFIRVEAVRFYGPATKTTPITAGVVVRSAAHFEYCSVFHFHGRGLEVDGSIGPGYNANYGLMLNCWFEDNTRDGFYIHGGNGNSWALITPICIANGTGQAAAKVWRVDADAGPSFTDITTAFNDATTGDLAPFPATEGVGDYIAVGHTAPFQKLSFNGTGGTLGVGGLVTWEYWNGSTWTAVPSPNDTTDAFSAHPDGIADMRVYFEEPQDWATTTINGSAALYWVRGRLTQVFSTNPVLNRGYVHDGAGVHDSSFLGCTYINPQTEANACPFKITGASNRACIIGPYAELDQGPCVFVQNACTFGGAINGVGYGSQGLGNLHLTNSNDCSPMRVPSTLGPFGMWSSLGFNSNGQVAFAWGADQDEYPYQLAYDGTSGAEVWACRSLAVQSTAYQLTGEGNSLGAGYTHFPQGYLLGNVGRRHTTASAAPTTGTWTKGAIVFNDFSQTEVVLCWVCTTAGTPGTWTAHNL